MKHVTFVLAGLVLAMPAWGSAASDLKSCRAISDDHARLACYDGIADKAAAAPYGFDAPKSEDEPAEIAAHITQVSLNPLNRFTVTLDNGQVWSQIEGGRAYLKPGVAIVIRAGIWDSHTLSAEGGMDFKVRRVK